MSVLSCISGSCAVPGTLTPRLLDETAKQDIDSAAIVFLARVDSVRDSAVRPGLSGYRPVELTVSILRSFKGNAGAATSCVIYLAPYGNYDGPRPFWIPVGELALFAVEVRGRCFRVVNDRRPFLRSFDSEGNEIAPMEAFIAESTLPTRGGCKNGVSPIVAEIADTTIPLVGSRETWALLRRELGSPIPDERVCACIVMAWVWRTNLSCLLALPNSVNESHSLEQLVTDNRAVSKRSRSGLQHAPIAWLKYESDTWGFGGTIIRLHELVTSEQLSISQGQCSTIANTLQSRYPKTPVRSDNRYTPQSELSAFNDLREWFTAGCPTSSDGLRRLLPSH
jgi:hypothetical protein